MRVLVLGNSSDLVDGGDGRQTAMWQIATALEELLGAPVELRHAHAYPNAGLVRYATRCIAEFDPDVVIFHCSGYVVTTASIELRMRHLFGGRLLGGFRLLKAAALRGLSVDDSSFAGPELDPLPSLYRTLAAGLRRLGAGQVLMSVDEATQGYAAVIRLLAAREDLVCIVRGPLPSVASMCRAWMVRRMTRLNENLRGICRERRVGYCDMLALAGELQPRTLPDRIHHNVTANALIAEHELRMLRPLLAAR